MKMVLIHSQYLVARASVALLLASSIFAVCSCGSTARQVEVAAEPGLLSIFTTVPRPPLINEFDPARHLTLEIPSAEITRSRSGLDFNPMPFETIILLRRLPNLDEETTFFVRELPDAELSLFLTSDERLGLKVCRARGEKTSYLSLRREKDSISLLEFRVSTSKGVFSATGRNWGNAGPFTTKVHVWSEQDSSGRN